MQKDKSPFSPVRLVNFSSFFPDFSPINVSPSHCRLTGENFDLREKIENLNDSVKRLKRQLKMYMKKLQESGGFDSLYSYVNLEVFILKVM